MNTTSIRLASLSILVAAALVACGPTHTSTVVQVSGHAVEVVETGSGDATVVLESGWGNDWSAWDQVITNVAPHARVFAYSRPGYGRSDATTEARDAGTIVEDLRALLAARGYAPPYVLVGHSFGGAYMELFAKRYPEEVAALVLVDPRHRDFTTTCQRDGFDGCALSADLVASQGPTMSAEYDAYAQVSGEVAATSGFGSYPVRVLTATSHGFPSDTEALWVSLLGALASEASDGQQIVYRGADHNLEANHARDVADVIVGVLPPAGI